MNKTNYIHLLLSILFLVSGHLFAQEVNFETSVSRNKLGINERLNVKFVIDKDADNFVPPNFAGFKRVGGPMQSVSRSYVNGVGTFQKSYEYILVPEKRGNLSIGQAEITYQGKVYKTSPVPVEVTAAVDDPNSTTSIARSQASDAIHLVAEASNASPYLNEGIYVVYKLYFDSSVNIRNWRPKDDPKFTDFWSQNIDIKQLEIKQGEFGGMPFQYVELRKSVLYPQKTGELTIEPLTLTLTVEVPTDRRDIFGRRHYELIEKSVSAKTRTIAVKNLPEEGKPASFAGAVGNFDFEVSTTKNELEAQESLTAVVKVSGTGNLRLFSLPQLKVPASLEMYEPERDDKITTQTRGMTGTISQRYTLVPQFKGKYPIYPLSFSYFDPKAKAYKTITSSEIMINVEGGASNVASNATLPANTDENLPARQRVVSPDMQFNYIQLKTTLQKDDFVAFFRSTSFWLMFLLPLFMIPVSSYSKNKLVNYEVDEVKASQRNANKLSKKYLSEAKRNIDDAPSFYEALEKSLHAYLRAKLKVSTTDITKPKIKELLLAKKVDEQLITDFIKLIEQCEFARYAPSTSQAIQENYSTAVDIITKMDKQL
jgi:hypothetical protein